ncbi:MAG: AAA family ATPase [Prevotellaceae bacterium]|jgi:predicted AAA+ superfamily ATPase|nr:AAA family ATPase [Prevotellaceae bacterium]
MKTEKTYIKRIIDSELEKWSKDIDRKPLLLRGARQVGKSSSVRHLAKLFPYFLEINFEKNKNVRKVFSEGNLSPQRLCSQLSAICNIPVIPGKTLLFFDEIQACLPAISSLRFFYEDYPELHVIAAGSLLEFALEVLPSFGVGRIRSLFMYPFSFAEFLGACRCDLLLEVIEESNVENPLHEVIHRKALEHLREFLIIGGMPEVVATYASGKDLHQCQRVLDDLNISLRNDFAKYKQRILPLQISTVFDMVSKQVGKKFVFSKSGQEYSHYQLKQALETLKMAGLVIPVVHTAATGIPLGAQINPQKQKMLLLDTGILQRLQNLQLSDILLNSDFNFVNKGSIAELFVGLELLKASSCYTQQGLYYWQREKPGSLAEVDYVIQKNEAIIPIEVKSGTTGAMQSLHLFLKEKNIACGVRTSLENFAQYGAIKVIPLYAISHVLKKEFI